MLSSRAQSKGSTKDASKQHHSRLPTKPIVELGHSNNGTKHVSKLSKSTGGSVVQASSKTASRARTPGSGTSYQYGVERQRSVTPAAATTIPAPPSLRTPSLASGSSASTFDSPRSNALRRKPSGAIDRYAAQKRFETEKLELSIPTAHAHEVDSQRDFDESIFGMLPPSTSQEEHNAHMHPSFQYSSLPGAFATSVLLRAPSSTPDTRYTDSPFSHVPTPSSASSYSPGFPAVAGEARPPQTRIYSQNGSYSRHKGTPDDEIRSELQPVRESSTSSSSTLRTGGDAKASQRRNDQSLPQTKAGLTKTGVRNKLTKEPHSFSSRGRTVEVPPELAHLNVDIPRVPTRPSRDGTSNISDMTSPSPVVQSELPRLYTTYHKRTSSREILSHDASPSVKNRFGFPSRPSSRNASPRIDSAISPPPTATRFDGRPSLDTFSGHAKREVSRSQRKDSPAVGPAPSPAKSPRFPFFSRKQKPETKSKKPAERPERASIKGPVAGTGHEGYGRFGMRGRSGSSTSNLSPRSPSSDSSVSIGGPPATSRKVNRGSKNAAELDNFLRDRLAPVVLRGSGSTGSQNDLVSDAQRPMSSQSSSPSLLPSAMDRSDHHFVQSRPALGRRNTSESSDDDFKSRIPSRLVRWTPTRASQDSSRSYTGDELPPQHLGHYATGSSLARNRKSALLPASEVVLNEEVPRLEPDPGLSSTTAGRMLNFWQRATASPRAKGRERQSLHSKDVAKKGSSVPISHFALTDTVQPIDLAEAESLVQDVETSQDESVTVPPPGFKSVAYEQRSISTPEQDNDAPKQSRLSPVGRIPAVVSRRDRDRKLPDHSFSRPFVRSQPRPTVKPPGSVYSQIRDMASPIEGGSQATAGSDTGFHSHAPGLHSVEHSGTQPESPLMNETATPMQSDEFITFSDRKDSQQSYISSSSGAQSLPSWLGPTSAQPPQQEDIWIEYDDLMDTVVPLKTPPTGSSLGLPFQYADYNAQKSHYVPPPPPGLPPRTELPAPPGSDVVSNILSVPQQVSRFLQPSLSPLTPDTITAWINGYGNDSMRTSMNRGSLPDSHQDGAHRQLRSSLASTQDDRPSLRSSRGSCHSRSASLPDAPVSQPDAKVELHASGDDESHLAHIPEDHAPERKLSDKMRRAALMTSKWLSFGRILFSPANNELRFASEARVLVIDGLSSDWSYYIARTYQYAEVYDMRIGSQRLSVTSLDGADAPKNHRQISVTRLSATFPFPRGFFTAVVLRFPTAATENSYLNCVSECKRVLRPGGHLEIAVLDLDLVNMGTKTRKAVKGLKTRMQIRDTSVCLGNLSDVLVRMIGRKGFEGVQRCVVGVPAAGRLRSEDHSSSGSESFPGRHGRPDPVMPDPRDADLAYPLNGIQDQMGELSEETDENITKMIAKVGRWWYSSCYEKSLLPTDRSIWHERGVLRECDLQRTSFRLLICHAQKPMQTRRRTVSV